jgi:hypothetical protein
VPACKLTKRNVDALPLSTDRDRIWWDEDLKGFGLKITPAERKVFLVQCRPAGDRRNPRKYTIGECGQVTPHQARVEPQRVLPEQVEDLVTEFLARPAGQTGPQVDERPLSGMPRLA